MENHQQSELWFSSLIGYFYQHGIGRKESKNKALILKMKKIKIIQMEVIMTNSKDIISLLENIY